MISVKLSGEEIENIIELHWEEIATHTFADRSNEASRLAQGRKVRQAMRHAHAQLEQGLDAERILELFEVESMRQCVGKTQHFAETVISMNRRMMRLSIEAMRPFAFLPHQVEV